MLGFGRGAALPFLPCLSTHLDFSFPALPVPVAVYVIGGIVDRTVVRGVSAQAAKEWEVETARLPLELLDLKANKATRALNVDTVLKVLMSVHANKGDWRGALTECLPKRKAAARSKKEEKRDRGGSGEGGTSGNEQDKEDKIPS